MSDNAKNDPFYRLNPGPVLGPGRGPVFVFVRRFRLRSRHPLKREEKEQKKQMDEDLNDIVNKTELFSKVGYP